jgi:hypothetical protein
MKFKGRPGIMQKTKKRHLMLDLTLFILFVGSAAAMIFGINIYRDTIVAPRPLALPIILGTIGTLLVLFFFAKNFLNAFYILFLAATIGGGNSYFLTLLV